VSFDLVVVGAGVAGSAVSWFAAQRGLRVALLDKARFPRDKVCTSTVNPRSCTYLQQVGALQRLAPDRLTPIRGFQTFAYDAGRFQGFYEPSGEYLGYGHTIPRYRLDAVLLDCVRELPEVELLEEFEVEDVAVDAAGEATVSGCLAGRAARVGAPLVVDAAGRGSPIGRRRGLFEPWDDHRRFAVISQFSGVQTEPLFTVGTNDAVGPGYFCVFPIRDDRVILSLMLTERDWARAREVPAATLESFVRSPWVLRDRFTAARRETPAVAFGPLAFRARTVTLERLLMVGDTTGFYDPLTGEGIAFAFRSGELAAEGAARLLGGEPWSAVGSWYARSVQEEKEDALAHAVQLQRMLALPGAFNRFVATLAAKPEAANWLARALGNLLPRGERSVESMKALLGWS
jgi:flavin-dependent dehydrogenase